ncbi:MAG: M24 family metallopeptidase [Bryobacterales bacterium]|nr:M24 family metallopeptidase [Bryobacterales bacterium]
MDLAAIQSALRQEGVDGWLFFDHHRRDPLAYRILGFEPEREPTRRWYYLIPAEGEPEGLVHRIESSILDGLPGRRRVYASWSSQVAALGEMLRSCRRVAMQYSPRCAIPYVSLVDAGTVELVRSFGVEVASSADLVQYFEARWTEKKLETHVRAAGLIDSIRAEAFRYVGSKLAAGELVTEWHVKNFILDRFRQAGLVTDHGPIVAVNENASDPHYEPRADRHRAIRRGDVLLIDLWAKLAEPGAVYYDITWTAYCGDAIPTEVERVFEAVRGARDAALKRVQEAVREGRVLRGFEVDDVARAYLHERGYEEYFVHRTGHSIGEDVHGAGANMDNLETRDERRIIPWTCFSIEPGVYLPQFGIRSEVNVFVGDREARVTGEVQTALVRI